MIKSMTGYGKSSVVTASKSVVIEIKTLNSKQLDLNTRIAPLFRERDSEIRTIVSRELERGKIDLTISCENLAETSNFVVDEKLAKSYFDSLVQLSGFVGNTVESDIFAQVLRMPEVIKPVQDTLTDDIWTSVNAALIDTCRKVNVFREQEGTVLAADLEKRVKMIYNWVDDIEPFEKERIVKQREKFEKALSDIQCDYDENRLEQEMIFYIEKLDVTEEKVRLRKHCNYFIDTLNDSASNGKKLGFIAQECGREINTLGSKSNHFGMQQIVVCMKDELEKIKEQLANVL
ncbi:MAG: YicC family protein [Bacteroidales bacterium]|nr:YicC family protein [Bacteroidales bacterium]